MTQLISEELKAYIFMSMNKKWHEAEFQKSSFNINGLDYEFIYTTYIENGIKKYVGQTVGDKQAYAQHENLTKFINILIEKIKHQ